MPASRPLLPDEFAAAIPTPRHRDEEPQPMAAAWAAAQKQVHPDLAAADGQSYLAPLETALYLYRRHPKDYARAMLAALGRDQSPFLWKSLAAAARDAFAADDWDVLGALASRLDQALNRDVRLPDEATESDEFDPHGGSAGSEPAEKLVGAFRTAFDYSGGKVAAGNYVRGALACLRSLPSAALLPPDVCLGGRPDPESQSWPLLRMFWFEHAAAWQGVANLQDELAKAPNPLVALFAARLRPSSAALPRKLKKPRNPFARLARGVAEEPPAQRPSPELPPDPFARAGADVPDEPPSARVLRQTDAPPRVPPLRRSPAGIVERGQNYARRVSGFFRRSWEARQSSARPDESHREDWQ